MGTSRSSYPRRPSRRPRRVGRAARRPGRRPAARRPNRMRRRPLLSLATVAAIALGVVLAVVLVQLLPFSAAAGPSVRPVEPDLHLVYTAPTANDEVIELPPQLRAQLLEIGRAHRSVTLSRVEHDGTVSTSVVDLTPRTGGSEGHVLKVPERARQAIDTTIDDIQADINETPARSGGRALYLGLGRISFTGVPVVLVSSGLDLSDPVDFRALDWAVSDEQLVDSLQEAKVQPALGGPVTFVVVPSGGAQPQLGQAQKDYVRARWTAMLGAAGATSVRFLDAVGSPPTSTVAAPVVPLPAVPGTPIPVVADPKDPRTASCTLPSSYFEFNRESLVDPGRTAADLERCVREAMAAGATFALDGWTSYEGPLDAHGQPSTDDPVNRSLSRARVATIADLLVERFRVPRSVITRQVGHGNLDQPHPDPRSAANRVVIITYTLP